MRAGYGEKLRGYLANNTNPILLLDDVLSELDRNRQTYLLNSLEGIQTIITCTGLEEFINNRFNVDKIYKVVEGKIEQVQE